MHPCLLNLKGFLHLAVCLSLAAACGRRGHGADPAQNPDLAIKSTSTPDAPAPTDRGGSPSEIGADAPANGASIKTGTSTSTATSTAITATSPIVPVIIYSSAPVTPQPVSGASGQNPSISSLSSIPPAGPLPGLPGSPLPGLPPASPAGSPPAGGVTITIGTSPTPPPVGFKAVIQPTDYSRMFWVGDGYDALSGERRASCLSSAEAEVRSYPVNHGFDTLDLVFSKADLARKLSVEMNAEASGTYQGVSLSPSVKTNVLRETEISSTSVVAVASYFYVKDRLSLYQSVPTLDPARLAELDTDKEAFRQHCGDKFTRSLRTGGALILVLRAEQLSETSHDAREVQETFKLGFAQLFGISQSVSYTAEQKAILSSYRISTTCYSDGVSAHPCGDNQLNLAGVTVGDTSILDRIAAAKKALATDISDNKVVAALDEELETYPVPVTKPLKAPRDVFYNYQPYLTHIQAWMHLEERVRGICKALRHLDDICATANTTIADAIADCALQSQWPLARCQAPRGDEFAAITDLANAGSITLWEHGGAKGRALTLSFVDLFSRDVPLQANVLYSLHDERFNFADLTSSVSQTLKNGWQFVLYEHADGSGQKFVIRPDLPSYLQLPKHFNDRASAFKLERISP